MQRWSSVFPPPSCLSNLVQTAECTCEGSGLGPQLLPVRRHRPLPAPHSPERRAVRNGCTSARASPPAPSLFFCKAVEARWGLCRALSAQACLEPVSSCWDLWEGARVLSPAPCLGPCPVAAGVPAPSLRRCLWDPGCPLQVVSVLHLMLHFSPCLRFLLVSPSSRHWSVPGSALNFPFFLRSNLSSGDFLQSRGFQYPQ